MTAKAQPGERGELALVLHSHMPYVEGFDTWPFGEEWLWDAIAGVYLPLLDVLREAPVTLGLTPVLCDQLEAPGIGERFLAFLRDVRRETHRMDVEGCRAGGASVSKLGVETYAVPPGRSIARKWSSTAPGSSMCSIVCRKTTASHSSMNVSAMSRRKETCG